MCVLLACEKLGDIEPAKEIHVLIIRGGFDLDVFAGIALINMYAKCNIMDIACQFCEQMFDWLPWFLGMLRMGSSKML